MPILSNPRHEAFAQALARKETADAAYQSAGYSANRGNATRMKANEDIVKRVAELQRGGETSTHLTIQEKRDLYAELARDEEIEPRVRLAAAKDDSELAGHVVPGKGATNINLALGVAVNVTTPERQAEYAARKAAAVARLRERQLTHGHS